MTDPAQIRQVSTAASDSSGARCSKTRLAERRRDRRTALALAVVFGLVTLSVALQRHEGITRYAKVRELTVEFTRLVQQLEKPSAWGF